jgi:DnaK suppressor protein
MGDGIDSAQRYDETYRQSAINAYMASHRPEAHQFAALHCIDCGHEIPSARRKAAPSATRCIGCQEKHERIYGRQ